MNTAQRHSEVSKLFLAACDLGKGEQDSYLDRVCSDDPGLRTEVRTLLDEDTHVENLLAIRAKRLSETHGKPKGVDSADFDLAVPSASQAALPNIPGYQIDGVLGQGGVGIVYRAREMQLGREVALKVLPAALVAANPTVVERFRREATAAARLQHDSIVPLYEFGECADCYFYTMELIEGDPLNTVIRGLSAGLCSKDGGAFDERIKGGMHELSDEEPFVQNANSSWLSVNEQPFGRAYFKRVACWISAVAEALSYAHECGIVHRDVKPGNLILSHDGRVMITDFGLALTEHEDALTRTGAIVGTLRYLSPEQALGNRVPIDHRTDIYSLGATLYELLTLCPLFGRASGNQLLAAVLGQEPLPPKTLNPSVPIDLETICLKALDKRPAARYAPAAELALDLKAFLGDDRITA
ncbi:MAG: serine/threonine protein kinase, partial [Planctomycetes bacterium]|nr:serine/threonine protein kinase [Planctomycetota bacterium]